MPNEAEPIIAVDLVAGGIKLARLKAPNHRSRSIPPFGLPSPSLASRASAATKGSEFLNEIDRLPCALEKHATSMLVFGYRSDPFTAHPECIHRALILLEELIDCSAAHLFIQTRSPFIVLGSPILRRVKERLSILIAIEAFTEEANRTFTPGLPSPNERLEAAKALKHIGFDPALQISPVFAKAPGCGELGRLARALVEASAETLFVSTKQLLTDESRAYFPAMPFDNTSEIRRLRRAMAATTLEANKKAHPQEEPKEEKRAA